MKEKTKAYMGGIVDGEGGLSISKSTNPITGYINYRSTISVTNTNPLLTRWALKHFGGTVRMRDRKEYSNASCFEWYLTGNQSQRFFLEVIRPYVCFKKLQVELLLGYLDLYKQLTPDKREELYQQSKDLHHNFSVETETLDPLTKTGRAYYAALVDGEGTITVSKDCYGHFRPAVRVYNANLAILKPLEKAWGGGIHEDAPRFYNWYINKKSVIESFLLYSTPYLLLKRSQAKVMLEFVRLSRKWNPNARNVLCKQISDLNQLRVKIQPKLTGDCESAQPGTVAA